ncbi:A disintegrin and metalloproteinase with thrombospondin motifs 12 [Merluccius polli]|uniref:A disintegrin and metalloproteinase with thrombospondin motifs 12 n=1 Tax=Merluccius polli TaxID=89951 RepID=A0AA47MBB9_MERPO|nr:A disintegrin and metalloproteinase with thrombospondin motifs 12 [Merluccius polli]
MPLSFNSSSQGNQNKRATNIIIIIIIIIIIKMCSALCGSGVQHRLIKCVDTKAEVQDEVEQARCDLQPRPDSTKKCNLNECESAPSGSQTAGPSLVDLAPPLQCSLDAALLFQEKRDPDILTLPWFTATGVTAWTTSASWTNVQQHNWNCRVWNLPDFKSLPNRP